MQAVGDEQLQARHQRRWTRPQLADRPLGAARGPPHDAAVIVQPQRLVGACEQRFRPAAQLRAERPFRGRAQHAPLDVDAGRLDGVAQALDPPDRLAVDHDRAVVVDRRQLAVAVQAFEQRLGAPVDEALGQALVQGIAQRVLDRARAPLPVERVVEPVRAIRDVRPGADVREPRDQGVDVAVDALQADHLIRDPVDRQAAAVGELDEDGLQQVEMRIGQGLAEIRDLAHRPKEPYAGRGAGAIAHRRAAGEHLQADVIERVAGAQQAGRGRLGIQRLQAGPRARRGRARDCASAPA